MALIKTIAEAKSVLPKLLSNLDDDSFLPNIDTAEEKHIVVIIGDDLYNDLQGKYDSDALSDVETLLVKHIALVTLSYGFLDELIASHVVMTDHGVRTMDTNNMPKAVGWEYKELKKYLQDRALDGVEVLLKFLWKHKGDFPQWASNEAYLQFERLLIRTGTDFNDHYRLYQPNRTFHVLKTILEDAQGYYMVSGIGKDLLKYFLENEIPSMAEKEIVLQLKKALAFLTVKHAGDHYTVRFSESGFTVVNEIMGGDRESDDSGRSSASLELLEKKLKACDRDGKNFMARAKKMLVAYRQSGSSSNEFNTAFDSGPLKSFIDPSEKTSGNERRKIFRF